jgi:hypothetical protein
MKKRDQVKDDLLKQYDFGAMTGGVRGKYYQRVREEGANIVLLDPDLAEAFPSEESVNAALRGVLATTRNVKRSGGLPNKALQPTSRTRKRVRPKRQPRAARD